MSTYRSPIVKRFLTNRQAKRAYGKEKFALNRASIHEASLSTSILNEYVPQQSIPIEEFIPYETKESVLGNSNISKQHLLMLEYAFREPLRNKSTRNFVSKYKNNLDYNEYHYDEDINNND